MCQLLAHTGPVEPYLDLLNQPNGQITCTRGVNSDIFNSDDSAFRVPYATIFTLTVLDAGTHAWSGVFAFDLLRKTRGKWSPAQEASRVVASIIAPDHDAIHSHNGCAFVSAILTIISEEAASFMARWQQVCTMPDHELSPIEVQQLFQAREALENDSVFQSVRGTFAGITADAVTAHPPSEFHVYKIVTLEQVQHDYTRSAGGLRVRIVSTPTAEHRYLLELRPNFTGLRYPSDDKLAQWLCAYLQKRRKAGRQAKGRLSGAWQYRIWNGISGKTESEHQLEAWSEQNPAKVPLCILIGEEKSTGLRVPAIETDYGSLCDIAAKGEIVSLKTTQPSVSGAMVPTYIEMRCMNANVARDLASALERRELRRLGRSKEVRGISVRYGDPWNSITLSGYTTRELEECVEIFSADNLGKPISVDKVGPRVFISAA